MAAKKFILASFAQDAGVLATWAARGVRTTIGGPNPSPNTSRAQFYAAAMAAGEAGVGVMLAPDPAGAANDLAQPNFAGWYAPDEPESWANFQASVPGSVATWVSDGYVAPIAAALKAKPDAEVFGNFTANDVYSQPAYTANQPFDIADYQQCCSVLTRVSIDRYLRNNGLPVSSWPNQVSPALQTIQKDSGGKALMCFIETSNQGNIVGGTGPTAAEVEAQCWLAIIDGCTGLAFFSHQFAPTFTCDGTPPDVAARITQLASVFAAIGDEVLTAPGAAAAMAGTNYSSSRLDSAGNNWGFVVNLSTLAAKVVKNGESFYASAGGMVASSTSSTQVAPPVIAKPTPAPPPPTPTPAPVPSSPSALVLAQAEIVSLKSTLANYSARIANLNLTVAKQALNLASLTAQLKAAKANATAKAR